MDRGRRSPPGPPTTIGSVPASARAKAAVPKIDTVQRKPVAVPRKPVPSSASSATATSKLPPILPPISSGGFVVAVGEEDFSDYTKPPPLSRPIPNSPPLIARDLDQYPRGQSPRTPHIAPQNGYFDTVNTENVIPSSRPQRARQASESRLHDAAKVKRAPNNEGMQRSMSLHPSTRPTNNDPRANYEPSDPTIITKTPRSPGPNKLTSFFGWKTSSPIAEVSPTNFSDRSHSPAPPSPLLPSPRSLSSSNKSASQAIDVPKSNGNMSTSYFADTGFPIPPNASTDTHYTDMEEELREISSELAGSIRREMELEDLVDRLQLEASQGPELGRRTSDYFSDSGSGSYRYPLSDAGVGKAEDLAKQKRISEQEKAQFKVGLTQRLQDERDQRKVLEVHVQQLGEQVQRMDKERAISSGVASRVSELESSLEDHRRRLKEERRVKENFEDLLTALRGEISQFRDERDNLREEMVPQLQARIEGLEGETAEHQNLTYENARMQQELQSLKNENTTLMNARRLQLEMQQHSPRFNPIAEEEGPSPTNQTPSIGLTRSASVARGTVQGGMARAPSLKRSNSISNKERESRESLADRVKDIEMQRDALHRALKSLLDRQSYQNKEHEKRMRTLEMERDRALENQSPRKMGYEKEVTGLRHEINQLRRRADDASMQKYQIEKGLGGLKKDLDRAEQETSSLRKVLQEHDILVPELPGLPLQEGDTGAHATSASLEKAYRDLQVTQAMSINKLRELHGGAPSSAEDADTAATMEKLLKSMNDAEAERDYAKKQAAIFRAQAESLREAESFHTGEKAGLADQLHASANRVEALSTQVRLQLESNAGLRLRLAEAVGRGEQEQKNSTTRINSMQGKLKNLEDKLMTAQQQSEEAFAQHEEEVKDIRESHNIQLQRLKTGLRTPTVFSSPRTSPLSPMFGSRLPRLDKTTSGIGMSLDEALRTELLEKKVAELERALGEADREMEEVVSRMNEAQIEVMELQSARDEAMRQTRKLQVAINAEREKVDSLMK
ncbi:hypothetical protein MMC28_000734 [Mycoblastus sanguinarius]|nr:hypothetical protein [Mycoblastus sanguinarius]